MYFCFAPDTSSTGPGPLLSIPVPSKRVRIRKQHNAVHVKSDNWHHLIVSVWLSQNSDVSKYRPLSTLNWPIHKTKGRIWLLKTLFQIWVVPAIMTEVHLTFPSNCCHSNLKSITNAVTHVFLPFIFTVSSTDPHLLPLKSLQQMVYVKITYKTICDILHTYTVKEMQETSAVEATRM